MVAQQAGRRTRQLHRAAQHPGRVGPAVDKVTEQNRMVAAGRELHLLQQPRERGVAALHIPDQIQCHRVPFSPCSMDFLLIALLTLLNGVFAMSELAVASSRKARLLAMAEDDDKGAAMALRLLEHPTQFLSTVQVGITSIGMLNGIVGEAAFSAKLTAWLASYGIAPGVASVAATAIV